MKNNYFKLFCLAILWAGATDAHAQVAIGSTMPDASAMLHIDVDALSPTAKRGLLPPRMTSAQRSAIPAPAEGLTVFNTDTKCLEFFDGTCWTCHLDLSKNGSTAAKAGLSCQAIKSAFPDSSNGNYWIDADGCGPNAPSQTTCNMSAL